MQPALRGLAPLTSPRDTGLTRRTGFNRIGLNLLAAFRAITRRYSTHSGSSYGGNRGAIAASVTPFCLSDITTQYSDNPGAVHMALKSAPLVKTGKGQSGVLVGIGLSKAPASRVIAVVVKVLYLFQRQTKH